MRNPIFQISREQGPVEHRKLLREAVRQLDRADLYLASVAFMDVEDRAGMAELRLLRGDLLRLRRRFVLGRDQDIE